ncbi:putative disease resistance protein At3g14460 [Vicia villosa]|uniref:putative disease resistance protein At3g14460 n=1 Tax=Vicia villosa TaxID=3911 RepID=UPI00273BCF63|nr:putative disease resistance protein At3g14460 [Vicia villosa]
MTQLRVFSLSNYRSITMVPMSIGDLSYLQYLNISHTDIERLPSETCRLYYLQFLLLGCCKRFTELPEDLGKLIKLRHLDVSDSALKEMPVQIATLKNLQTFSNIVVSWHNDGLKKKDQIDELALEWDYGSMFPNSEIKRVALELLQPATNLKSLTIKGYGGISFPNWLGDFPFSNMVSSFQPFLSLEIPHFEDMQKWDEWNLPGGTSTKFPNLKTLSLSKCPKLRFGNIPRKFPSLTELELRECALPMPSSNHDCNELESIPPGGLATPNLVYFAVWKCEKLLSLTEATHTLTDLQEMEIDNLPNIQSFVIDDLPNALRELTVGSIGGVIWNTEQTWEHLTCLSVLRFNGDGMVKTLMGPLLPASLVTLYICGLNDTSIDEKWLQHPTSLQNLEIINASKLKSLPMKGYPSSHSLLSVTRCPLLKANLRKKGGGRVTSTKALKGGWGDRNEDGSSDISLRFSKGDDCWNNYDRQQLSVRVDFCNCFDDPCS